MGMNLEEVLTEAKKGSLVNITIVSNQNNGIASYAEGSLLFHPATPPSIVFGGRLQPASMKSTSPLKMFFSDRRINIDPPPVQGSFGVAPRQPFNANDPENLGLTVNPGLDDHQTISISINVFGNSVKFNLERMGDLYVGVGPSLSESSGAVFVLAFIGIRNPPA